MASKLPLPQPPQLGDDARSVMPVALNESVGPAERAGTSRAEMADGPKMGEKGEFLPSRYIQPDKEVALPNGSSKIISGVVIEDF